MGAEIGRHRSVWSAYAQPNGLAARERDRETVRRSSLEGSRIDRRAPDRG
ncbi:hypothetical protein [Natronococcus sp. A-GB7]|nr:hypothetical protein [Natronococcus sp. A-GB7]MDG5819942.1 hypothetical protein [Natronococcus sp. A-GB7]